MGTTDKSPLMAGVSLAGFIVSGLIFGQMGVRFGELLRGAELADCLGHRRRGWLLFSFGSQAAIIVANLVLVAPGMSRIFRPEGELGWIYLLLLAVQGGIQVTQVRRCHLMDLLSGCQFGSERDSKRHDDHSICCFNIRSSFVRLAKSRRCAISESTRCLYRRVLAGIIRWGWPLDAYQYLCRHTRVAALQDHGFALRHSSRRTCRRRAGSWECRCLNRTYSVSTLCIDIRCLV